MALNALHLPYPVAVIIFANLLAAPGFLLLEIVRTGSWDDTARIVLANGNEVTWEWVASAALFALVNVLVFLGIRGMRMRLVAAKAELVGL